MVKAIFERRESHRKIILFALLIKCSSENDLLIFFRKKAEKVKKGEIF
jgi:hypothetical protein